MAHEGHKPTEAIAHQGSKPTEAIAHQAFRL